MNWLGLVLAIISGILVCIPLCIKLCSTVQDLVQNKNWNVLINLVSKKMIEAQSMFNTGEERKEFVLGCVSDLAVIANYTLQPGDYEKLSDMIDSLCIMANVVGKKTKKTVKKIEE